MRRLVCLCLFGCVNVLLRLFIGLSVWLLATSLVDVSLLFICFIRRLSMHRQQYSKCVSASAFITAGTKCAAVPARSIPHHWHCFCCCGSPLYRIPEQGVLRGQRPDGIRGAPVPLLGHSQSTCPCEESRALWIRHWECRYRKCEFIVCF